VSGRFGGQFERFTPSRLSDRNGFVKVTLAGAGATDGNAPIPDLRDYDGTLEPPQTSGHFQRVRMV